MHESTSVTETDFIADPAEVQLHDLRFAREAAGNPEAFMTEFIGRLAHRTSLTPEGRIAWADALKAVSR